MYDIDMSIVEYMELPAYSDVYYVAEEEVVVEIELSDEEVVWLYFKDKGLTDAGIAGMMGNLYHESYVRPTNLQDSYERGLGHNDQSYTAAVDNGSYRNFVNDSAGYGIAQWTYWSRKQGLLNMAVSTGRSIGDIELQLDYLWQELNDIFPSLLNLLMTTNSISVASDRFLVEFENPRYQNQSVKNTRTAEGQRIYDECHNLPHHIEQLTLSAMTIVEPEEDHTYIEHEEIFIEPELDIDDDESFDAIESLTIPTKPVYRMLSVTTDTTIPGICDSIVSYDIDVEFQLNKFPTAPVIIKRFDDELEDPDLEPSDE